MKTSDWGYTLSPSLHRFYFINFQSLVLSFERKLITFGTNMVMLAKSGSEFLNLEDGIWLLVSLHYNWGSHTLFPRSRHILW